MGAFAVIGPTFSGAMVVSQYYSSQCVELSSLHRQNRVTVLSSLDP
jgi:hypothetical protein